MADDNAKNDDMKHCYENLILIDASASLTNKKFSRDLDSVIQRAQDAGKLCGLFVRHCGMSVSVVCGDFARWAENFYSCAN